jgi:hypothetical protein
MDRGFCVENDVVARFSQMNPEPPPVSRQRAYPISCSPAMAASICPIRENIGACLTVNQSI